MEFICLRIHNYIFIIVRFFDYFYSLAFLLYYIKKIYILKKRKKELKLYTIFRILKRLRIKIIFIK